MFAAMRRASSRVRRLAAVTANGAEAVVTACSAMMGWSHVGRLAFLALMLDTRGDDHHPQPKHVVLRLMRKKRKNSVIGCTQNYSLGGGKSPSARSSFGFSMMLRGSLQRDALTLA